MRIYYVPSGNIAAGAAEAKVIKDKHKSKSISKMNAKDLAEIVELLAIAAGIANSDGTVK